MQGTTARAKTSLLKRPFVFTPDMFPAARPLTICRPHWWPLRGTVEDSEHRIARLLFKLAVETSMMMNVLAAGMEISEEDLRQLRARCVREVKQTNGNISLKDAVKYQKGQE